LFLLWYEVCFNEIEISNWPFTYLQAGGTRERERARERLREWKRAGESEREIERVEENGREIARERGRAKERQIGCTSARATGSRRG